MKKAYWMLDRRLDEDEKTTISRPQRQFDEKRIVGLTRKRIVG
jgi:hypothetical protein